MERNKEFRIDEVNGQDNETVISWDHTDGNFMIIFDEEDDEIIVSFSGKKFTEGYTLHVNKKDIRDY